MDRVQWVCNWMSLLKEASEWQKWGQILEASERYEVLLKQMKSASSKMPGTFFPRDKERLKECERLLQTILRSAQDYHILLPPLLQGGGGGQGGEDPIGNSSQTLETIKEILQSLLDATEVTSDSAVQCTGRTSPQRVRLTILRVGVKNPDWLNQPFVSITVRGVSGDHIEPTRDTDYSTNKEPKHIIFNQDVLLKTLLYSLPKDGNILFELKHYQPSKRAVAVKCFSVLDISDLREGVQALEIYKRPTTSFIKQKFNVFSRKLYLHINVAFIE